jgi:hypothetical protein
MRAGEYLRTLRDFPHTPEQLAVISREGVADLLARVLTRLLTQERGRVQYPIPGTTETVEVRKETGGLRWFLETYRSILDQAELDDLKEVFLGACALIKAANQGWDMRTVVIWASEEQGDLNVTDPEGRLASGPHKPSKSATFGRCSAEVVGTA